MSERTQPRLDAMIRDFAGQLLEAKERGLERSHPARYRAMIAALRMALTERHGLGPCPDGDDARVRDDANAGFGFSIEALAARFSVPDEICPETDMMTSGGV
jgi:hypothetical protein